MMLTKQDRFPSGDWNVPKKKYKKSEREFVFWIFLFTLACVGFATAADPTTPTTLSPINNSVYFGSPELTCSGSTDPDGDGINITFYSSTPGSVFCTDDGSHECADWTCTAIGECSGAGGGTDLETNYVEANTGSQTNDMIRYYNFTSDTFDLEVSFYAQTWSDFGYARVIIDGDNIWEKSSCANPCNFDVNRENITIDTSAYNGEGTKQLKFRIFHAEPSANQQIRFYQWFDTINMTKIQADNVTSILQNSTSTTFEWTDLGLGFRNEWACKACDTTGACSNQTDTLGIYGLNFYNCSISDDTNTAFNFTIKDEENLTAMVGDLDYTLTLESLQDSKVFSNALSESSTYHLCLSPDNLEVNATGFLEYLPDSAEYTYPRQYYLRNDEIIGNNTQHIDLFSLTDAFSTAVTFIASRAGSLVQDILIHLQKYDPGSNTFSLVAMGLTSSGGNDILYLRLTDAWYRVLAYENSDLVFTSGPEHITSTTYLMNLAGGPGGAGSEWFTDWINLDTINFNLNYTNATTSFLLTADDSSGASTSMCLKVDQYNMLNGTTNICYSCVDTSSATISCVISDTDSYYVAQFIAYQGGMWKVLGAITADLSGKIADTIGLDAAFYAFLLVGVSAFAAIWSPAAAIILSLLGVTTMQALGFLDIAWSGMILLIAAGIILLAGMYKRRNM